LLFVRGPDQLLHVGWIEVAAAALMAAYFAAAAHHHGSAAPPRFRRESMASLVREALPIGGSQLLWSLNLYLPTLALAGWLGSQAVGYYGAAHRIVFALGSFVWLYFFNLFPVLVRATRDPGAFRSLTAHSFRLAAWAGTLVAVTLSLLATLIAEVAFGTSFAAAGRPLAMLVWVLPVTLLSGHARFALIASGNQTLEMLAQGGGVLATLLLAALLIPAWGPSGAALSVLGSAVVVWGLAQRSARAVGLMVPGPRRLVGPAFAACAALAAARLLPALLPAAASPLLAAALAAMLLLGAAAALEPQLRADGRRLLALGDAAGPAGSGEQGSGRSAPGE
jgi:O-antigen/teichoic acid export membrane protein